MDGTVETHVRLSPHTPAGDPPEPEELIKAIQDLENNSASADESVRLRIAQLPNDVSEVGLLSKIEGKFGNILFQSNNPNTEHQYWHLILPFL